MLYRERHVSDSPRSRIGRPFHPTRVALNRSPTTADSKPPLLQTENHENPCRLFVRDKGFVLRDRFLRDRAGNFPGDLKKIARLSPMPR